MTILKVGLHPPAITCWGHGTVTSYQAFDPQSFVGGYADRGLLEAARGQTTARLRGPACQHESG